MFRTLYLLNNKEMINGLLLRGLRIDHVEILGLLSRYSSEFVTLIVL